MFKKFLYIIFLFTTNAIILLSASPLKCSKLPTVIATLDSKPLLDQMLKKGDLRRNAKELNSLCMHALTFSEASYRWRLLLVYSSNYPRGPFWFLPHDNENTAFDSAVYATKKYGGGFLAVDSGDKRYFNGQDPNRNFGDSVQTAAICKKQKYLAPLYNKYIFKIIDTFKKYNFPYLALHNNANGWYGNGGSGSISILKKNSKVLSYPSKYILVGSRKGILDEDSMVYIAGTSLHPPASKLQKLKDIGLNVKYEIVNKSNNDCSMSNYVVLEKNTGYFNIETEHGDAQAQKRMIDKLMVITGSRVLP